MGLRGDESGMFWHEDPPQRRGDYGPRPLPPIPETDWRLPTEYPSLEGQGWIAIDVETFDPDLSTRGPGWNRDGRLVGVAIGTQAGFRQYYPIDHEIGPNLPADRVLGWLRRELIRPVPKVGANIIYDLGYLAAVGVEVSGPYYDVQVAEPLLDETRLSYALESLAQRWLGEGKRQDAMTKWLTLAFGNEEKRIKSQIWRAPSAVVGPYAEGDVDLPLRIFAKQKLELESLNLWELFMMESKLIPLLLAMRRRGVRVNLDQAEKLKDIVYQRRDAAVTEIKKSTGFNIDIWAAGSIAKIFDAQKIAYPRTAKTNQPSFRKGWLETCPAPVARLIAEARRMDKYGGTFIEGYILNGHVNGRLHTQFNQLRSDEGGAVSGRFSSSMPNLQNLPIRDEELGPLIRAMFLSEEGEQWWKYDWSQIEFRLAVHYAAMLKLRGVQKVVEEYRCDDGTDYHEVVAKLTGLPRKVAKNINFGFVYGMGIETLCDQIGVSYDEGKVILYDYHNSVPFVRPLYDEASHRARQRGEIITIGGRHRRFNVWNLGNQYFREDELLEQGIFSYEEGVIHDRQGWQRAFVHKALNALLQGSAADIMKKGMVQIWESGVCNELGAPHLTVHDELDGSLPEGPRAREALAEVKNIMETCVSLLVPMRADGGVGANWSSVQ